MSAFLPFVPKKLPSLPLTRLLEAGKTWGHITMSWVDHGLHPNADWHKQSRFALNYLIRGTGTLIDSQGQAWQLGPGNIYHHFPESRARLSLDSASGCVEFYLLCDPATYEGLQFLQIIPEQEVLSTRNNQLVLEAFARFYELCSNTPRKTSRRLVLAGLVDFLSFIYDLTQEDTATNHWHETVHAAAQRLEADLGKKIRLPDVARIYGVSYASFRREFKRILGISPAEYRIRQRIEAACRLLSRHSVKEVAEQLGYCDPFTFSSQFKAFTGLPPSQFRIRRSDVIMATGQLTARSR